MKFSRKVSSIMLAMALGLAVTGCGNSTEEQAQQENSQEAQQESSQETYQELTTGDAAPDFTAELADGGSFTLSEQSDKVVLLNFWATWCGPCVQEMPAFEKLAEEYKDDVAILAVNCQEDTKTVDKFIEEMAIHFRLHMM